jgi:two-component system, NarL family, nitrate/nitrite response regulator NarL
VNPPEPISVVVVDDSRPFLDAICFVLRRRSDIRLIGTAADAEAARRLVERERPDVAVVDVCMPGTDGIELTRMIRADDPRVRVVAVTVSHSEEDLAAILRAGACGYVLKPVAREELPRAIASAVEGGSWVSPHMASKLIASYLGSASVSVRDCLDGQRMLTPRERAVLAAVADGRTNKQIADGLYIAETTVKTHLKSIFAKLEVGSRSEAAAVAWRLARVQDGDMTPDSGVFTPERA